MLVWIILIALIIALGLYAIILGSKEKLDDRLPCQKGDRSKYDE